MRIHLALTLSIMIVFLLIFAAASAAAAAQEIPNMEMIALNDLYNLNGVYWNWNYSLPVQTIWNFTGIHNPCEEQWQGVTCTCDASQQCNVAELSLSKFNISGGPLSESIGNLAELTSLVLEDNAVSGTIPSSLYDLNSMSVCQLGINKITGGLSQEISKLTALVKLSLADNFLSSTIPSSISALGGALQVLDLQNNRLSQSIPPGIYKLTYLTDLQMGGNKLTGHLSSDMSKFSVLRSLRLNSNNLQGSIPSELGQLASSLQVLDLSDNSFSGSVPTSIGSLTGLKFLRLSQNELNGHLDDWLSPLLQDLVELSLYSNHFSGTIPQVATSSFKDMRVLSLQSNNLHGPIDGSLDPSTQLSLEVIDVSNNQLTSTIPSSFFSFSQLKTFGAASNCFSGAMPAQAICGAQTLETLVMDGLSSAASCQDRFHSSSPSLLADVTSYRMEFHVTGDIDSCLFNMPELGTLRLSGNNFRGSISDDVKIGANLRQLSLSHNKLHGSLPTQLLKHAWKTLDLSHNKFNNFLYADDVIGLYEQSSYTSPQNSNNIAQIQEQEQQEEQEQVSISLSSNRISGQTPTVLRNVHKISLLNDNIFSCGIEDRSSLPEHDQYYTRYDCGSNSFNVAWYLLLALWTCAMFILLLAILLYKYDNCCIARALPMIHQYRKFVGNLSEWISIISMRGTVIVGDEEEEGGGGDDNSEQIMFQHANVLLLFRLLTRLRISAVGLTTLIVGVMLPIYLIMSVPFSTYGDEFAWRASASFLSGKTAAIVLLFFWSLILICLFTQLYVVVLVDPMTRLTNSKSATAAAAAANDDTTGNAGEVIVDLRVFNSSSSSNNSNSSNSNSSSSRGSSSLFELEQASEEKRGGKRSNNNNNNSNKVSARKNSALMLRSNSNKNNRGTRFNTDKGIDTDTDGGEIFWNGLVAFKGVLLYLFVFVGNVAVVTLVNGLYAVALRDSDARYKPLVQSAMALVSIFWNDVCVNQLTLATRYYHNGWKYDSLEAVNIYVSSSDLLQSYDKMYHCFMVIFNTVAIPCLVTAVSNSLCFQGIYTSPHTVYSSYSVQVCDLSTTTTTTSSSTNSGFCTAESTADYTSNFLPSFSYSFQCSSAVIMDYSAMYLYWYTFTAFLVPLWHLLLKAVYMHSLRHGSSTGWFFGALNSCLPEILKPVVSGHLIFPELLFEKDRFVVRMLNALTILATFGLIFPPLALCVCMSIVSSTIYTQITLARFIHSADTLHLSAYTNELELECRHVLNDMKISAWMPVLATASFCGLVSFDVLGDEVGGKQAIWAPVSLLVLQLVMWLYRDSVKRIMYRAYHSARRSGCCSAMQPLYTALRLGDSDSDGEEDHGSSLIDVQTDMYSTTTGGGKHTNNPVSNSGNSCSSLSAPLTPQNNKHRGRRRGSINNSKRREDDLFHENDNVYKKVSVSSSGSNSRSREFDSSSAKRIPMAKMTSSDSSASAGAAIVPQSITMDRGAVDDSGSPNPSPSSSVPSSATPVPTGAKAKDSANKAFPFFPKGGVSLPGFLSKSKEEQTTSTSSRKQQQQKSRSVRFSGEDSTL